MLFLASKKRTQLLNVRPKLHDDMRTQILYLDIDEIYESHVNLNTLGSPAVLLVTAVNYLKLQTTIKYMLAYV
jgi:hypothetical protein